MGLTVAEKILGAHAGVKNARPKDIIYCSPDVVMGHDLTVPHAAHVFRQLGSAKIRNPSKLVFVHDHFQPAKCMASAELSRSMREFAVEHGIKNHFDIGRGGIGHNIMIEMGLVGPGMLVAGADSHTMTCGSVCALGYAIGATDLAATWALDEFWVRVPRSIRITVSGTLPEWVTGKDIALRVLSELGLDGATDFAIEFHGDVFDGLPMADRITLANHMAETGATTVMLPWSGILDEYHVSRVKGNVELTRPDPDAEYAGELEVDVESLQAFAAVPNSPANIKPVEELADVKIDQVFIGSCANGTIDDFRRFMSVLGDRKFHQSTRVIAIPATQETWEKALREGILEKIALAGGSISTPTCGPCVGGHYGVLAKGETCLSTSNRNFRGRMGHHDSLVYLASPYVAAATAVTGRITHPGAI